MKKSTIIFILALSIFIPNQVFAGIRCGDDIIDIGDSAFLIQRKLKKCGEVLDKEVIETSAKGSASYDPDTDTNTINYEESRVDIELWWIRVEDWGSYTCYPIILKEGKLIKIEKWERCD